MILKMDIWGRRKTERIPGGTRIYWDAESYCYSEYENEEEETVRDERHTAELLKSLVDKGGWIAEKPVAIPGEFQAWFSIILTVRNSRGKWSDYMLDYRAYPGAPFSIRDVGMELYRRVRKNAKQIWLQKKAANIRTKQKGATK